MYFRFDFAENISAESHRHYLVVQATPTADNCSGNYHDFLNYLRILSSPSLNAKVTPEQHTSFINPLLKARAVHFHVMHSFVLTNKYFHTAVEKIRYLKQ